MSLKILMAGNNEEYLSADQQLLKDRGFRVINTLALDNIHELIEETQPDIIFLNYQHPEDREMASYHQLLEKKNLASLPVIFTLAEDEVYLVTRRRSAAGSKKNIITDSIINAVKMAFTNTKQHSSQLPPDIKRPAVQFPYFPARA